MFQLDNINRFVQEAFTYLSCDDTKIDIEELFLDYIDKNEQKSKLFNKEIQNAKKELNKDLDYFFDSDPAANTKDEIILAYPGYLAIAYYRIAHILYQLDYSVFARIISETAHKITGIDIHPGANINSPFFIDHGTGIVIGETAIVGKNVKIYQGVTLGALSLSKGHLMKGTKRHPTIGNNVTIYAGASILGDISVGDNVTIGSNAFIIEDVPSNVKVKISKPELIVKKKE